MERKAVPSVKDEVSERAIKALTDALDGVIKSPMASGVLVEDYKARGTGTLNIPHGLGRRAVGCLFLGADRGLFAMSVIGGNDKYAVVRSTPQWEYLARIDANDDLTGDVDFDASINGDLDNEYMIRGFWITSASNDSYLRWTINGTPTLTNDGTTSLYTNAPTAPPDNNSLVIAFDTYITNANEHSFEAVLQSESGRCRFSMSSTVISGGTTNNTQERGIIGAKWKDNSVEIRTLGISTVPVDCRAGSYFELFRRPKTDGRTMNLWIF